MNVQLPKKFSLLPIAEVNNGTLFIYQLTRFEDLMYELTYACKKRRCIYCGKKLNKRNSTLDHRYPRDTGGISITNNLYPCCPRCNSNKGNLTHEEYLRMRKLPRKERKKYIKILIKYKEKIFKKIGFKLPNKWITHEDIRNIEYKREQALRGKKYHRIIEFYSKYKKLPRPAIIDKNNKLLDGYNIIIFANDFGIKNIAVIKLDNVIMK